MNPISRHREAPTIKKAQKYKRAIAHDSFLGTIDSQSNYPKLDGITGSEEKKLKLTHFTGPDLPNPYIPRPQLNIQTNESPASKQEREVRQAKQTEPRPQETENTESSDGTSSDESSSDGISSDESSSDGTSSDDSNHTRKKKTI